MIQTQDLSYAYPGSDILHFPDIHLQRLESLLVLGNSGRGKTTFLHLLAGLLRPHSGEIKIGDTPLSSLNSRKLDQFRGKNVGLIFQKAYFIKALTVEENLVLAQQLTGKRPDRRHIGEILATLNIDNKASKLPSELSVGEQQRSSIARAVINKPSLILADEPTSALDDVNAGKVADLLNATAQKYEANLIIVTHDQRLREKFKHTLEL